MMQVGSSETKQATISPQEGSLTLNFGSIREADVS